MKVIQVTERYPPAVGGVETHVMRLSQELSKLGIEVEVLTTDLYSTVPLVRIQRVTSTPYEESVTRVRGYPLLPLPQGLGIVSPSMLRHLRDATIVHAHGYGHFPTYLTRFCGISNLPVVATTHSDAGRPSIRKTMFDIIVPRLSIRFAQKIIAISNHEKQVLIRRGVSSDRIVVIPNGIDVEEIDSKNPKSRKHDNRRTLMYSGRIDVEQKGLDILIEAFARLISVNPEIELVLMGPDWNDSTRRLRQLASKLGIDEKVHFMGYLERKDYLKNLRSADIFVLPSRFEPFGIVLLEAIASSVPIVASNAGGIPEILGEGKFGLLFNAGDVDSLVSQLQEALSNEDEAAKRAEAAKGSLNKYAWSRIAEATLRVYTEVLSKQKSEMQPIQK